MNFKLRWRARLVLRGVTWTAFQKMELPQSNTEGVKAQGFSLHLLSLWEIVFGTLVTLLVTVHFRVELGCSSHWQPRDADCKAVCILAYGATGSGKAACLDFLTQVCWRIDTIRINKGYIRTYVYMYIYISP